MDGERIIKLSGQGSVYIRCLEPFEEEDRDEDDEQLTIPSFSQCTSDLSETPVNASSSSLQHQNSEAEYTDPGELYLEMQCPSCQKWRTISQLTIMKL